MKQLPDEVFRRRLKDQRMTPPPSAWSRIETNLPGRRRTAWLRIAAAVLLLLASSVVIWSLRGNGDERHLAGQRPIPGGRPDRQSGRGAGVSEDTAVSVTDSPAPDGVALAEPAASPPDVLPARKAPRRLPRPSDRSVAETTQAVLPDTARTNANDENAILADVAPSSPAGETGAFKLVLHADEVSAKYLRKKSVARATEDDTKASGLKKLLNKANDISNQDPIGDLRQMKNDIFALNFQSKKRDQRK